MEEAPQTITSIPREVAALAEREGLSLLRTCLNIISVNLSGIGAEGNARWYIAKDNQNGLFVITRFHPETLQSRIIPAQIRTVTYWNNIPGFPRSSISTLRDPDPTSIKDMNVAMQWGPGSTKYKTHFAQHTGGNFGIDTPKILSLTLNLCFKVGHQEGFRPVNKIFDYFRTFFSEESVEISLPFLIYHGDLSKPQENSAKKWGILEGKDDFINVKGRGVSSNEYVIITFRDLQVDVARKKLK